MHCRNRHLLRGAGFRNKLNPDTARQTYFKPGDNKGNYITGYETEVVNLTGHRFGGIFAPFAHPGTGKSAPSAPIWFGRCKV